MAVNLLAPLGDRYGAEALSAAVRSARVLGYELIRIDEPDDRLCAWIDWRFAPSWWSSETREGSAWYAQTIDGEIAGFAAFGLNDRTYAWLRAYRGRDDLAIFGPYGVAPEHRGRGLGEALLTAALCALAEAAPAALIPAVGDPRLIAMYEQRAGAQVADTYDYALPHARTVILASGNGTNAQAAIDAVAAGRIGLDVRAIVTSDATAGVRERARTAGLADEVVAWERSTESRAAYDARLGDRLARYEPELVLLLGWMHLLPATFLARFPETLNVHPAFLPFDPAADDVVMPDGTIIPAFRGAHAVRDALAAGARWSGASVHRVTAAADRGAILVRTPVPLEPSMSAAGALHAIRPHEHGAVVAAIRRWGFERDV